MRFRATVADVNREPAAACLDTFVVLTGIASLTTVPMAGSARRTRAAAGPEITATAKINAVWLCFVTVPMGLISIAIIVGVGPYGNGNG